MLLAVWRHRANTLYIRSAPGALLAVLMGRWVAPPLLVLELNGWIADEAKYIPGARYFRPLLAAMQRFEVRLADHFRVVTPGLAHHLSYMGIPGDRTHVIATGTSLDTFDVFSRDECRRQLGIGLDDQILVFVGNLWEAIDIPTALKGLKLLQSQGQRLKLFVVGGGPMLEAYKTLAGQLLPADTVTFTGWQSPEVAARYIGSANVAIALFRPNHGGKTGLSPLKLRDYAASGRIAVTTDAPGIRRDGTEQWLFVVDPENPAAFADGVAQALKAQKPEHETMARVYAEQNFGWQAVADRIVQEILNETPRTR